ncbi:keratin-associated protein 13-2-like [Ornithorhynchus anatinus]|uniref:keratin-associated protein 13-2-like n=1 Tax=Ornithorhynchus anatinus TaxID=9258 RepID=UPI0004543D01|nr:keratin-associated protein 13-2-like [Ornithorhynchus anatinus]
MSYRSCSRNFSSCSVGRSLCFQTSFAGSCSPGNLVYHSNTCSPYSGRARAFGACQDPSCLPGCSVSIPRQTPCFRPRVSCVPGPRRVTCGRSLGRLSLGCGTSSYRSLAYGPVVCRSLSFGSGSCPSLGYGSSVCRSLGFGSGSRLSLGYGSGGCRSLAFRSGCRPSLGYGSNFCRPTCSVVQTRQSLCFRPSCASGFYRPTC